MQSHQTHQTNKFRDYFIRNGEHLIENDEKLII